MSRKTDKKTGSTAKPKNTANKTYKKSENMKTPAVTPHGAQGNAEQASGQVIPFRQPGWDKKSPWLANQEVRQAANGFAPVAQRYNHSRGK